MVDPMFPAEIGLLCGCIPREPILAAGFLPRLIRGTEDATSPDSSLPHNLCAHVRRSASWLSGPEGKTLAGIVLTDGCYPMLRLRDFLLSRPAGPQCRLLRMPRSRSPEAVRFLECELREMTRALSALPGALSDAADRLPDAILAEERRREAGRALPVPGGLIDRPRTPRLLVRGSYFLDDRFFAVIRALGAEVGGVDSCEHPRAGTPPLRLREGEDPFRALADWCLRRPPCPRSESACGCEDDAARAAFPEGIDGVVYLRMKQCTPQGYDLPEWRSRFRESGMPFLALEIDGPDCNQPQIVTRIEAFLESLKDRILEPR